MINAVHLVAGRNATKSVLEEAMNEERVAIDAKGHTEAFCWVVAQYDGFFLLQLSSSLGELHAVVVDCHFRVMIESVKKKALSSIESMLRLVKPENG